MQTLPASVAKVFDNYPPLMRRKLLALRKLILEVAASTDGVGEIEETLKWGEPAYVTKNKTGSLVRIDWKKKTPDQYMMYFHCQTSLIETFRILFPDELEYEGNRAIVFEMNDDVPKEAVSFCIRAALTYHRKA